MENKVNNGVSQRQYIDNKSFFVLVPLWVWRQGVVWCSTVALCGHCYLRNCWDMVCTFALFLFFFLLIFQLGIPVNFPRVGIVGQGVELLFGAPKFSLRVPASVPAPALVAWLPAHVPQQAGADGPRSCVSVTFVGDPDNFWDSWLLSGPDLNVEGIWTVNQ